jgi:hypothetical protein
MNGTERRQRRVANWQHDDTVCGIRDRVGRGGKRNRRMACG